jgi:hypothetical protein
METLVLYGDTSKTLAGKVVGEDDVLDGMDGAYNLIYGDALRLAGQATGGDDTITGGSDGAINWLYGDAYSMQGLAVGGDDIIVGGMNAINNLYGDAHTMVWNNVGGDDTLKVGQNLNFSMTAVSDPLVQAVNVSTNRLYGDAQTMLGGTGGSDILSIADTWTVKMNNPNTDAIVNAFGYANANVVIGSELTFALSDNNLFGDAQTIFGGTTGSDILSIADTWTVSMNNDYAYAYASALLYANAAIGSKLTFALSDNNLFGDAQTMVGGTGGSDILSIADTWTVSMNNDYAYTYAYAFDDANANAVIGSTLTFALSDNNLFGDAQTMLGGIGGSDILSIADTWTVTMNNDYPYVYANVYANSAIGSTLTVALSDNNLFGDAYSMTNSTGGNDTLSIATGWQTMISTDDTTTTSKLIVNITDNMLVGDAHTMVNSKGGNDILSGADFAGSTTYLTGDGIYGDSTSKGGNDTLISGKGNDFMWGDFGGKDSTSAPTGASFGKDTFVFQANNGQDIIYDFHRGDGDQIKLLGIAGINASTIAGKIGLSNDGLNNVISFDDGSTITVVGVTDLADTDFLFA